MHTCPDCGQACYCNGDIDDHETGEDDNCQHWLECEDEADDDWPKVGAVDTALCWRCGREHDEAGYPKCACTGP